MLGGAFFATTGLGGDHPTSGSQSVKLQLKWHHQFQFAGYYAALAKGYYQQEGLDVTIIEGDEDHPPIQQVRSGKADFGVSDADVLKAFLEGQPVVVLASIFQHSPYILMTRADSGIRTPSDLRGKTIMLSDEQGIAQLKAIFRREGMSLQSVRIVPHQWNNELLINRQVDAVSAYSTVEPFQLKAKGVEPGMIQAMDYGVDFYGDTLFSTEAEVQRHPARVAAFRRASLQGWEYAMAHPEEIIEVILKMPGVQQRGITREMLRYEADAMRKLILPGLVEIGHMNPGRWQMIARTYADIGVIRKAPSEEQLQSFLYDPSGAKGSEWLAPLLISLGIVGLVALWVLVWNAQLRRAVANRTAALQRAEQKLRYHVENSPLAVVEWDDQFRVRRWTGQAEQVFGWKAAEVMGKHPHEWQFVHEQDRAAVEQNMEGLQQAKVPRNISLNRNYRKDGSVVHCEWYNSASRNEQGKNESILSLVLNVTDRIQAEAALRLSEERFRGTFENAAVGIANVGSHGEWLAVNQKLCDIVGYSKQEMLQRSFQSITHPDDLGADVADFEKLKRGEINTYSLDKRYIHKAGHPVWIHLTVGARHNEAGRLLYCISVIQDISDRKRAELQLQRAREELAHTNAGLERRVDERTARLRDTIAELEQFSYALTHDLRAPLRAMSIYSGILQEDFGRLLPDEGQDYLRRIKVSAERMDQLILDALNYSKVVRGKLPINPVNLGKLLRGMIETYPNLQEPGAEVCLEFNGLNVMGNESALTQIFSNLLGNAVKFVAPGTKPRVRVWAEEKPALNEQGDGGSSEGALASPNNEGATAGQGSAGKGKVLVWVEDNGIGIPKQAQENIFGMFQRMHGQEQYPGTGIGLAIVRKSLARIGGQVRVESEPGKGSRFCVELEKGE